MYGLCVHIQKMNVIAARERIQATYQAPVRMLNVSKSLQGVWKCLRIAPFSNQFYHLGLLKICHLAQRNLGNVILGSFVNSKITKRSKGVKLHYSKMQELTEISSGVPIQERFHC